MVDIGMAVLLPLLMARHLTGEAAHEWIGAMMLVLFILHHALNYRWFPALLKGRYGLVRILNTAVNLLLLLDILMTGVSGIMMSAHVFSFWKLSAGVSIARQVHLPCAFWGFLLMSFHIGLHWQSVLNRIRTFCHGRTANAKRLIFIRVLALLASAYGIYAFFKRRFPDYLFLKTGFAFFDYDEPLLSYLLDMIAIMVLFAALGYCLVKWFAKVEMKRRKEASQ